MTEDAWQREGASVRRATIRTTHVHAAAVAASLVPDNTDEMRTTVVDDGVDGVEDGADGVEDGAGRVETVIERETTGGLRTTADDYVTNLQVAEQLTTDGAYDDATHEDTIQS